MNWFDFKFTIFQKKWEFLVYGTSFVFSIFIGVPIQTIILFVSFNVLRPCFPKTFHHDIFLKCIQWSIIMFFICISELLLFPIYITISGGIIVALMDCYILYLIQDHIDCVSILKKLQNKTIWQMAENELADYCYAKGIRGDMLEFVVMIVVYQMRSTLMLQH